jgi:uncharacterized membrane protein YgcG
MKTTRTLTPLLLILAAAVPATASAAVPATASTAPIRQFEGTVVSVNSASRTFRLNDSERGTKRIKVTPNTRFERINGFSGLRAGLRNVEATVRRSNGRWVAVKVERSGGGGHHGGGGSDDR